MRGARLALVAAGLAGLVVGASLLLTTVRPVGLAGLGVWMAAAILLHDAVLSPLLFAVGWVLRAGGRRMPPAAVAVVQVAAIAGGVGSLLLLPAIHAKRLGPRNPTILPFDYGANLVGLWTALAVSAAIAVAVVLIARARRTRRRTGGRAAGPSSG